jgi:hypothetical protein
MSEPETTPGHETSACRLGERRAFVRLASDLTVTCRPSGRLLDAGWAGTARDISRGGVGLLLRHRFRPGTALDVELRQPTGALLRTIRVRVVHATATLVDGSPCWVLGCAFSQPLSDEELEALQ